MLTNLTWRSLLDPLREPAIWVAAVMAATHAIEEAVAGQIGWGELVWVAVYAAAAVLVRAVVTPIKNQTRPLA